MKCFLKHKWLGVFFLVGCVAGVVYAACESETYKTCLGVLISAATGAGAWYALRKQREWEKRFVHEDWKVGLNFFPAIIIPPNVHCCGKAVEVEMRPIQFQVIISDDGQVTVLRDNMTLRTPYDPLYITIIGRD